ncbi:Synaptotagmin-1 Synaptotagmin I [Channa argus]|uniref:Synaptotagmin-1 Synaptotagmin I n=1 Tax=Channa argus TaxID=215402 RepID=A0A6G1QUG5_CHAAH|nr:Synaptotagmin-1 Synaptotagmin I [Channa argus]
MYLHFYVSFDSLYFRPLVKADISRWAENNRGLDSILDIMPTVKPSQSSYPKPKESSLKAATSRPVTIISTTYASTNTTLNPVASTIVDFINNLLDQIPLPRWAIYTIFVAGVLLILLCCLCICIKCCCRGNKKKRQQKKSQKIGMKGVNGKTTTALVQPDVNDVDYGSAKKPRGKLLYSLEYNAASSELTIGIKQADSLKAMDLGKSSDPYAKVYIVPDKVKTCETKVFKQTLNPVFNEQFTFQIHQAQNHRRAQGAARQRRLEPRDRGVAGPRRARKVRGTVQNSVLNPDESVLLEENLGDICFSLRYVPTAGKLTVVILEAKNLKSMDVGGASAVTERLQQRAAFWPIVRVESASLCRSSSFSSSHATHIVCLMSDPDKANGSSHNDIIVYYIMFADPYVKVQLALDKRKWKKRKTSVKKKTLNPYYNESFTFDVSFEQIQRVNLVISVWDHDTVSRNDAIGKIYLGCDAAGNQLRHWADMLSNPRRPVAQWHNLLSAEQVNSTLALKKKIPLPGKLPF